MNIRAKLGLNVLAIRRAGEIIVSPAADLKIGSGDVVVVLGDSQALRKVRKL